MDAGGVRSTDPIPRSSLKSVRLCVRVFGIKDMYFVSYLLFDFRREHYVRESN